MVVFPNAKINLGLHILGKRQDGYHELETCFYPVPWQEILDIVPGDVSEFHFSGIEIPGNGKNIIEKAYDLVKADYNIPSIKAHLHKVIPIGAGLGGGSADAAFALRLLNDLFDLQLDSQQLKSYAGKLGADCAFFIDNKPAIATGIGEKLETASISLAGKYILMVYPGIHISTPDAYAGVTPRIPDVSVKEILTTKPVNQWKGILKNDFELSLFPRYPGLAAIKSQLYDAGAIYASMSGSGSTIFGIFDFEPKTSFPENYTVFSGILS